MNRKVQITTDLHTGIDGVSERVRHLFEGEWRISDGKHLLSHNEESNHGRTQILLVGASAEIRRAGVVSSRMIFSADTETFAKYDTPHGRIPMTIATHDISVKISDSEGNLRISYSLRMAGRPVSENTIEIEWKTIDE